MDGDDEWPVTIGVLAERVGMTPRNIRAHQSRGVLPPPAHQGRFALYDREHLDVLLRIKELQAKGYSLAAVDELLTQGADDATLLQRLVLAPLVERDDVVLTWNEMAGMFDQPPSRERYRRAVEAGLVEVAADGNLVAPSARLLRAARDLIDLGVHFQDVFDLQVDVALGNRDIARRFVEVCLERALEPYTDPVPPEQWTDVTERFERLYRLMASVLAASFTVSVRRAAEALLAESLDSRGSARVGDEA